MSEGFPNDLQLKFVIARSGLGAELAEELADNVVLTDEASMTLSGTVKLNPYSWKSSIMYPIKQAPYALSLNFPGREVTMSLSFFLSAS